MNKLQEVNLALDGYKNEGNRCLGYYDCKPTKIVTYNFTLRVYREVCETHLYDHLLYDHLNSGWKLYEEEENNAATLGEGTQ